MQPLLIFLIQITAALLYWQLSCCDAGMRGLQPQRQGRAARSLPYSSPPSSRDSLNECSAAVFHPLPGFCC